MQRVSICVSFPIDDARIILATAAAAMATFCWVHKRKAWEAAAKTDDAESDLFWHQNDACRYWLQLDDNWPFGVKVYHACLFLQCEKIIFKLYLAVGLMQHQQMDCNPGEPLFINMSTLKDGCRDSRHSIIIFLIPAGIGFLMLLCLMTLTCV